MTLALHGKSKNRQWLLVAFALLVVMIGGVAASAGQRADAAGDQFAVFTSIENVDDDSECENGGGTGVNCNIYTNKQSVYLNGGPEDAFLPDGWYCFSVYNPNTDTLLSTDLSSNRTFEVVDGDIVYTAATHDTGIDSRGVSDDELTIAFFPYNDTSNPGGVYKYALYQYAEEPDGSGVECDQDNIEVTKTDNFKIADDTSTTPQGELTVVKTAALSYDRACTWDVTKVADDTETVVLDAGDEVDLGYTITVSLVGCADVADSGVVSGTIDVTNSGTAAVTGIVVTDTVNGTVIATVNCGTFDGSLDPDESVQCTYSASVAIANGTNVATATGSDADGVVTDDDTVNYTVGAPADIINECVDVVDDNGTPANTADDVTLGTVCFDDEVLPRVFGDYTIHVGPVLGCSETTVTNTVVLLGDEDAELDSDDATVTVTAPCVHGKTQGFWGNKNGQAIIPATFTYTLGGGATCVEEVNKNDTKVILPGLKAGHNGLSLMEGCILADGISVGTFNNLLSQTLALYLNITFIDGYAGQTVADLGCTADFAGLDGDSIVQEVLAAANAAIAAGGTDGGAFNELLGCLNREA